MAHPPRQLDDLFYPILFVRRTERTTTLTYSLSLLNAVEKGPAKARVISYDIVVLVG